MLGGMLNSILGDADGASTLTPIQKTNMLRKLARISSVQDELMDPCRRQNELLCQASEAEYEEFNLKKAFRLYTRAIEEDNHALGFCNLALWYLQGRPGYPTNPRKAVELFERAAKIGVGMALANLSEFTLRGMYGVAEDKDEAYKLARAAINDDRHTGDSLAMAFWVLFQLHKSGRPSKPKSNSSALRCLEYVALIDGPAKAARRGVDESLRMMRVLAKIDPEVAQSETDRRYDRMAHELDNLPADQKPSTYGEYVAALRRYGFTIVSEKRLPRNRDLKCDWPTFMAASGTWRLIPDYKPPEDAGSNPRDGGDDDEDEFASWNKAANGGGASAVASGGPSGGASGAASAGFMCGQCKKMGATKKCARCGQHYCSVACQRQDWREGHKQVCDQVAAERL